MSDGISTVRRYLASRPQEWLIDRLLELACVDDAAMIRLEAEAGVATGDVDEKAPRALISDAFEVDGHLSWRATAYYAEEAYAALDALEPLLEGGAAESTIALVEHAMVELDRAAGRVDDSSGHLGQIADRLRDLHLAACAAARPDPLELARRLVRVQLSGEWEWFLDGPERYAAVLGEEGLAELRRVLEPAWSALPALAPGEGDHREERLTLKTMMESLARAAGSVDDLVAVKSRDLSSAFRYVDIVETLLDANRDRDAFAWAERGVQAFGATDHRLRELAVGRLIGAGRGEEARDLVWRAFSASPSALGYEELRRVGGAEPDWTTRRSRALKLLRTLRGRTELVLALLSDGEVEAAWGEAVEGGCSEEVWLRLAGLRAAEHPDDALGVYRRALAGALEHTGEVHYRRALELLGKMRRVCLAAGRGDAFVTEARAVREANRRRPRLTGMLDAKGWW